MKKPPKLVLKHNNKKIKSIKISNPNKINKKL